MDATLFDNEDKIKEAIVLFNDLQKHPGWQLFLRVVNANVEELTERLTNTDFESLEDQKAMKKLRQAYIDVRDTPKNLVERFTNKAPENAFNDLGLDPYHATIISARKR
jgi:hypothetical protein